MPKIDIIVYVYKTILLKVTVNKIRCLSEKIFLRALLKRNRGKLNITVKLIKYRFQKIALSLMFFVLVGTRKPLKAKLTVFA